MIASLSVDGFDPEKMRGLPSPTPDFLWGLAREYQQRTEAFDRTVCTGPVGRDGVMPVGPRQLALVGRNAREVLNDLRRRAEFEGYSFEELRRAMRSFDNSPEADLMRIQGVEPGR